MDAPFLFVILSLVEMHVLKKNTHFWLEGKTTLLSNIMKGSNIRFLHKCCNARLFGMKDRGCVHTIKQVHQRGGLFLCKRKLAQAAPLFLNWRIDGCM